MQCRYLQHNKTTSWTLKELASKNENNYKRSTNKRMTHFDYIGCDNGYNFDNDITNKLHKFSYVCRTIYRSRRDKTRIDIILKHCKTLTISVLLRGWDK